jgi:hypothetical protein
MILSTTNNFISNASFATDSEVFILCSFSATPFSIFSIKLPFSCNNNTNNAQ